MLLALNWGSAHEIMKRAVERGLEKRGLDSIRNIGIDEKSFGQGQDCVSLMADPKAPRVIEVAEGRTEESAKILRNSLTDAQKSHIAAVSIDMWQAFENSVASHAPQAEIVFDRFQFSKHLNEGVDKVRREEHPEMMKEGDDEGGR
uniref:Transposase, IS204/IS1001/IS1096/IS1165 family protein n=1 Tax=uncultured bacterium A1Q1_fos_1877 TaxID=1256555 RepID=L7VWU3_9BACT|nr:transposase, IS204/IS1001/IS1096/IS1165 family protein [uncultured bacterium A1Q1_fos_1877]